LREERKVRFLVSQCVQRVEYDAPLKSTHPGAEYAPSDC